MATLLIEKTTAALKTNPPNHVRQDKTVGTLVRTRKMATAMEMTRKTSGMDGGR